MIDSVVGIYGLNKTQGTVKTVVSIMRESPGSILGIRPLLFYSLCRMRLLGSGRELGALGARYCDRNAMGINNGSVRR